MAHDQARKESDTAQPQASASSSSGAEGAEVRARTVAGGEVADPAPQHPLGPPPTTLTMPATQRPGGTTHVTPATLRENMLVLGEDGDTVGTVDCPAPEGTVRLKPDALGERHWLPLAWIVRVDDRAHLDRPGLLARQAWLTSAPTGETAEQT